MMRVSLLACLSLWSLSNNNNIEAFANIKTKRVPSNQEASFCTLLASRKPFITGNWKLNPETKDEAVELATGIAQQVVSGDDSDVALFVPFPYLEAVQKAVGDKVTVGAEAIFPQDSGAYTGGISAPQLKSIGVNWALAGHSERRTLFGESDEDINEQCLKLIENGMNVVLCIGETEEEYELSLVDSICELQLKKALVGVSADQVVNGVTIAYEPVWAIGTGKVATPEIAQSVHAAIRDIIGTMYDAETADRTRILYGGSVAPDSIDGLMECPDIDGALVGGASLDAGKFGRIINFDSTVQQVDEPEAKKRKRDFFKDLLEKFGMSSSGANTAPKLG